MIESLRAADRPLSVDELRAAASLSVPAISTATVYRNLRRMVEEGQVVVVELPGEPPRYEMQGKRHHHHFCCRVCDRVFDAEGCPPRLSALLPAGFELEHHEIVLYGRCRDCARSRKKVARSGKGSAKSMAPPRAARRKSPSPSR